MDHLTTPTAHAPGQCIAHGMSAPAHDFLRLRAWLEKMDQQFPGSTPTAYEARMYGVLRETASWLIGRST